MEGTWDKIGEKVPLYCQSSHISRSPCCVVDGHVVRPNAEALHIPIRTYFASLITPLEDTETTLHLGMTT